MSDYVRLYHATNRYSAEQMKIHGMGLDESDYERLRHLVAGEFDLPASYFSSVSPGDEDSTEVMGGVSFFPTLKQAKILAHYGEFGGEFRGSFVTRLVKRACRKKKIPYSTKRNLVKKLVGGDTSSVVVKVLIPANMIANQDVLGSTYEHYTVQKVPPEYILGVQELCA